MKIISRSPRDGKPREVELTEAESQVHGAFNRLLDEGHGIPTAIARVREEYPPLPEAFYLWLGGELPSGERGWMAGGGVGIRLYRKQWETLVETVANMADDEGDIELHVRFDDGRLKVWVGDERWKIGPQGQYE